MRNHSATYSSLDFNRNFTTRNICVGVLILSWVSGLAAICSGAYLLNHPVPSSVTDSWIELPLSPIAADFVSLVLNIFVTFLNEGLGYIHTVSLRWSLQKEHRLAFHTNLRLFSSSRHNTANKWYANTLVIICMVLTYSTPSLLFATCAYSNDPSERQDAAELSPATLIFLGIGILGQAIVATWALSVSSIPTWSSNPIDTVKALLHDRTLQHVPGRCMMDVNDSSTPTQVQLPKIHQPPILTSHKHIKEVFLLLWALIPLGGFWGGIIYWLIFHRSGDSTTQGTNWSPVPTESSGGSDSHFSPYLVWVWGATSSHQELSALVAVAFVSALQAIITITLHCVELIINLYRDEKVWRTATTEKGCRCSTYNSITAACKSWPTVLLFIFKVVIHWFFGLSLRKFFDHVDGTPFLRFRPVQIFYLTAILLVLTIVITFVGLKRPRGPQPAAYGHLQTLADLIDEWPPMMDFFWGHKWKAVRGCHAGTSDHRLGEIWMGYIYSGG